MPFAARGNAGLQQTRTPPRAIRQKNSQSGLPRRRCSRPFPPHASVFQTLLTQLIGSISPIVHSNSAPNFLRCDDEPFCFSDESSTRSFGPRSYKKAGLRLLAIPCLTPL